MIKDIEDASLVIIVGVNDDVGVRLFNNCGCLFLKVFNCIVECDPHVKGIIVISNMHVLSYSINGFMNNFY